MTEHQREAADRLPVLITIDSRQDDERVTQQVEGELFRKGSNFYIRYIEAEPQPERVKRRSDSSIDASRTQVTLKVSENLIKLTRRGQVESEQSFALGARQNGYYRSSAIRFPLTTVTSKLSWDEPWPFEGPLQFDELRIAWSYQLYIEERCTGKFNIRLRIIPA
ncbi:MULTISPECIES: DUF1934 domain-containing protein [Paenibacillus]|uniref:DUF1934 family protein n=1 Tax=Paenibacillus alvei TaxID=44250 RepID=A0AAP6ZYX9_PAEAL|nr:MULTISPECIES: DUF1934 domain-containing protein [Paenibacillus]MBG9732778.1 hypothetical protein [Paenibacillus alvei]MBG9744153.1 hypothetical protein [Paenibacillus alvei]MCY7487196.1 DUF1934 domain-containing protein [Paenibacillus alvei]MCY9580212.1 DUF1934 domain-containing protein [Paenibacillus alvei]MCY9588159.1 DUF1934 domain-containing protein [Paenibacillus alvei]